jgi:Ca-activated chloride channel family protein
MKYITLVFTTLTFLSFQFVHCQEDPHLAPYFHIPCEECAHDAFPLLRTEARVDITGVIADVRIRQVYSNEGKVPIEAVYVFPGSTRAAVYDMQMRIGERQISAVIQEKNAARRTYQQAREQGKRASLLEQERPNVFQMSVANIMPGDEVVVEIAYTEWLTAEDGTYELVFPTVVGPRYGGESSPAQLTADRWVENPYLQQDEPAPFDWSLDLDIQTGIPIQQMISPSHIIDIQFEDKDKASFRLEGGAVKDFILQYRLKGKEVEEGVLLYEGEEENFFLLMMQPPERPKMEQMPAREYIFIVDVSGSMGGFPLEVSKKLLRDLIGHLQPADRFNVLLFAGGAAFLAEKSLPTTTANLERAIQVIDQQGGGGGTNMLSAIQLAMALPKEEGFSRSFVIATDGYVNVEPQLFDYIRQHLGEANFFPFGIGAGVNRHLIEGIAHIGQAEPFVVTKPKEAPSIATKFREYITTPVLTDLRIDFGDWDVYDVTPAHLPDLLAERPVMVFGKYRGKPAKAVTLYGRNADGFYESSITIDKTDHSEQYQALRYLWARHRLKTLADYSGLAYQRDSSLIRQITGLGLQYNLLTDYTSFVAVDTVIANKKGDLQKVKQPLPLPEGVPNSAVGGRISQVHETEILEFADQSVYTRNAPNLAGNWAPGMPPPPPPPPEPQVEEPFKVVEEMPRFPTPECEALSTNSERKECADQKMMDFVYRHLRYPIAAEEKGIEGTVVVHFTITTDGDITDIEVVRDIGGGCGDEARRVVELMKERLGKWISGRQRGRPVAVRMSLPVKFRLVE